VFIAGFPAGPWGTNCYVVATGPGAECVVVDPGKDAAEGVDEVVREHRLKPVAVLLTHGHIDHMWCVRRSPARTTPRPGSTRTTGTCSPTRWPACRARPPQMLLGGKYEFAEPDDVRELADGASSSSPASSFVVDHTPGHTAGSVTFRTPYDDQDISEVMFSGDLLFAGSIGRTDLPGGDHATMLRSLRRQGAAAADDIVVLPGHGEQTSIGRERATNPYLLDLPGPTAPPRRVTRGL
jgi:hydroxyacylglutathione hydrolase